MCGTIEELEYDGWLVIEEELQTNINWNNHSQPIDFAALSASDTSPLSQTNHTIISTDTHPFWLDSGATIHISPERSDFTSLRSVPPRYIKGLGGMSVLAVAIGDIKIWIGHGTSLILCDVLYVPEAQVRLISVRGLTCDSSVMTHFDHNSCWLTTKSTGTTIAQGSLLTHKNLYALSLSSAQAEHALVTQRTPTIETWHRRLGHANYQAIQDMLKKGLIKGAKTISPRSPPKCDSCIIGKQTKTPVPKIREKGLGHRATRKLEKVWVDLSVPHSI